MSCKRVAEVYTKMLEIYEKKNGEFINRTIKVNDLGMNQSIDFTVTDCKEFDSKFSLTDKDKKPIMKDGKEVKAKAYLVKGIYHKSTGDVEVAMWFNQSKPDVQPNHVKDLFGAEGKRVNIQKTKKEGSAFHYYKVTVYDVTNEEQELINVLKQHKVENPNTPKQDFIDTFVKQGVSAERAETLFKLI